MSRVLPVLHGDVSSAARALLAVPENERALFCTRLLDEAAQAAAHVRRSGRLHPRFGNGSLMAAARQYALAVEPGFDNTDYCACVIEVLRSLMRVHHGKE